MNERKTMEYVVVLRGVRLAVL